jgi:hypothetical protein
VCWQGVGEFEDAEHFGDKMFFSPEIVIRVCSTSEGDSEDELPELLIRARGARLFLQGMR